MTNLTIAVVYFPVEVFIFMDVSLPDAYDLHMKHPRSFYSIIFY